MLNEDHTTQRQRAFAFDVAKALREIGFTHFGAETFTPDVSANMKDGVPKLSTGVYTLDPVFADLARHSAQLGYQLFDDEIREAQQASESADRNIQIAAREQAQADNIKKVLDANPDARLFIYLGGGHASKIPEEGGREMMALRLKHMTGIDPLVVDQQIGTPRSNVEYDGELYRGIANLAASTVPLVMTNASGQWLTRYGHDLAVFHPINDRYCGSSRLAGNEWIPQTVRAKTRAYASEDTTPCLCQNGTGRLHRDGSNFDWGKSNRGFANVTGGRIFCRATKRSR